jgi:phytoene synthase
MIQRPRLSYCAEQIRRHDHDRYLTCLFAPAERRPALFALYAFNLEIAKTAEVVSEPLLGEIRLQWWREALDEIYQGRTRQHEVVEALAGVCRDGALSRSHFDRLIDSRARDLEPAPPADLAAFEAYAEGTSASLTWLALEVLGGDLGQGEAALRQAGRHVGIAWATVGLLRAVPFHARRQRLYLPEDHLTVSGVDREALFRLEGSERLSGVVMRLAKRAGEHLVAARALAEELPAGVLPALLPARLCDLYLQAFERADYDPFAEQLQTPLPGRAWRLWLTARRKRF